MVDSFDWIGFFTQTRKYVVTCMQRIYRIRTSQTGEQLSSDTTYRESFLLRPI